MMMTHLVAAAVASKHASKLGEVAASISSSAQERLAQQGPALPAAKQLDVPQPELVGQLCCPPELVLVEHFRVQRKQILEVRITAWVAEQGCCWDATDNSLQR
jgi:hypothetical protein